MHSINPSRRAVTVGAVTFMFLAGGCGKTDGNRLSPFVGASKRQPDIQVVSTTRLIEESSEHLTFAHALPEGGFLAAAQVRGAAGFVYRLSSSGGVVWRTPLRERGFVTSGGVTSEGNYWVGGTFGDPSGDAVKIISGDGVVTEQHTLTRLPADRWLLVCAVEHDHKYLQASSVILDQYQRIPVSSISMTDAEGARLWEKLIPFEHERRISPSSRQILSCAGIFVTDDEHVLATQQIGVWRNGLSNDEIYRDWVGGGMYIRPATLVMAFDLKGREIARLRDDDTKGGLLIPARQGAVLVESSYLKPPLTPQTAVDERVHVRWLNSSMQDVAHPLVIPGGRLDLISAAYLTPNGGLLLAGCSGSDAKVFVRYIAGDRSVSPKKELAQAGNCNGSFWFSAGTDPNEELLLTEAAPDLGAFVTTLRTSD